ncbi:methyltransferase domain-containing protein [bacterium]|nr:methyltransferase domain-containing protein [bacterium]
MAKGIKNSGLNTNPQIVAELGPGDSLGVGLAALLSGARRYYAFDIIKHSSVESNLKIFEELISLFKNRANIPGESEFPKVKPYLDNYDFPSDILNNERLKQSLKESRIRKIRDAISNPESLDFFIQYKVPWYDVNVLKKESIDVICSQAVLEHVDGLENCYEKMYEWLKPLGYISHTIDFKSHGLAKDWNGHWCYSEIIWKLIRGRRPYLLNRESCSTHIGFLRKVGFEIKTIIKTKSQTKLALRDLAPKFQHISKYELTTSDVFIQAIKYEK